jgi:pilus assembly protein FimV
MVRREANWGQIARNTDTDSWTFGVAAGGGRAMLKINRIEDRGGGMLDVDASIVDSTEKVMAQNNTMVARSSTLNVDLPAGDYTLIVKGGGEGTPARGFSNYSSVGLYAIEGTITGGTGTPSGTGGAGGGAGTGGTTGAGGTGGGGAISGAGGASGAAGRGGTTGTAGTTGAAGSTGTAGTTGAAGTAGTAGAAGRGGTTGTAGTAGTTGAAGTIGVAGTTGTAGVDGAAGNTGTAGGPGVPDAGSGMPPGAGPGQVNGGCSCDVSPAGPAPSASLLAAMAFGSMLFRRRGRGRRR